MYTIVRGWLAHRETDTLPWRQTESAWMRVDGVVGSIVVFTDASGAVQPRGKVYIP